MTTEHDPLQDGITHLNVYSRASTELGRALSNFQYSPINHPKHGHFSTIEGLWQYLATGMKHDVFRTCTGFEAKSISRGFPKVHYVDFETDVKFALRLKVMGSNYLIESLRDCTLEFTHYYYYGSPPACKIIYPSGSEWVISYLNELRLEIQNEIEQD